MVIYLLHDYVWWIRNEAKRVYYISIPSFAHPYYPNPRTVNTYTQSAHRIVTESIRHLDGEYISPFSLFRSLGSAWNDNNWVTKSKYRMTTKWSRFFCNMSVSVCVADEWISIKDKPYNFTVVWTFWANNIPSPIICSQYRIYE